MKPRIVISPPESLHTLTDDQLAAVCGGGDPDAEVAKLLEQENGIGTSPTGPLENGIGTSPTFDGTGI